MCEDMVACFKQVQKKAMRTIESIVDNADNELKGVEIDKLHHLLEIVRDSEKMRLYYEEEKTAEG